jgi:ankyrin repeat protein
MNFKMNLLEECRNKNFAVVKKLLVKGQNPNKFDYYGKCPLYYAIENNNIDCVKKLLYYDANPNLQDNKGFSILMRALSKNISKEILIELLRSGADITIQNYYLYTPKIYGYDFNHVLRVRQLLNSGKKIDISNNKYNALIIAKQKNYFTKILMKTWLFCSILLDY